MAFGRYLVVGVAATSLHYILLFVLVEACGLAAPTSAVIGALGGALLAYAGNRQFTFAHSAGHTQALPRFLAVAATGAAVNGLIVWAGTSQFGLHYMLAQVLATMLVVVLTFQMNRAWTFKRRSPER